MTTAEDRYVIMTALAFDETGETALREAARIAAANPRAELHVVHVYGPGAERQAQSSAQQRTAAPETLRGYVERACMGMTTRVTGHIRSGGPVREILSAAAELDADVIVLGTHRRGGPFLPRRIAESVMRGAHCPVLIAVAKSHERAFTGNAIEPRCPACELTRARAFEPSPWCERHSRKRGPMHTYTPTELSPRVVVL